MKNMSMKITRRFKTLRNWTIRKTTSSKSTRESTETWKTRYSDFVNRQLARNSQTLSRSNNWSIIWLPSSLVSRTFSRARPHYPFSRSNTSATTTGRRRTPSVRSSTSWDWRGSNCSKPWRPLPISTGTRPTRLPSVTSPSVFRARNSALCRGSQEFSSTKNIRFHPMGTFRSSLRWIELKSPISIYASMSGSAICSPLPVRSLLCTMTSRGTVTRQLNRRKLIIRSGEA